jgi:hypothetical protein
MGERISASEEELYSGKLLVVPEFVCHRVIHGTVQSFFFVPELKNYKLLVQTKFTGIKVDVSM